ncbi:MAG: toprim domain-containing protein, partial [Candidatus Pacearchaeota archaeon]|nr:toprim domain-containing protein [Candidatus Pacearchaeota archaeon]
MKKRKEKQTNTGYVPLDEEDLKRAVEVKFKHVDESSLIKIERPGKIIKKEGEKGKTSRVKKTSKVSQLKTRSFMQDAGKIDSKLDNYSLIITEKPQAAEKIALALGKPRKLNLGGVSYYSLERDKKQIVVACAVGHLFNLATKQKGWPIFDIFWQPSSEKTEWIKKYYLLLGKLVKNASSFIVATDYDIEGEVIGWNIIRFIAKQKDASRMKFSTLTNDELNSAYDNLSNTLNWGQAIAGETRHKLDWMYGINLS